MTRRPFGIAPAVSFGLAIGMLAACQAHHDPVKAEPAAVVPDVSTSAAETKPASRAWEAKGVRVMCPEGWQEKKDPDFELFLIPPGEAKSGDRMDCKITFDVPDLPPHLPFMIQMSRVEHDYQADLKKAHPDLKLDEGTDAKIPNTTARLLHSSWHENGEAHEDMALLMIHASGVYILDAQAGEKQLPATRGAFEFMRASIVFTK